MVVQPVKFQCVSPNIEHAEVIGIGPIYGKKWYSLQVSRSPGYIPLLGVSGCLGCIWGVSGVSGVSGVYLGVSGVYLGCI